MSVINRMLKDLDKRQQTTRTQTYTPAAVAPQPVHWLWIVLTVLISAAVILAGLNLWWMYADDQAEAQNDIPAIVSIATPEPAKPDPVNAQAIVPQEAEQPAEKAQQQSNQAIVDVSALPVATVTNQLSPQDQPIELQPELKPELKPEPAPEPQPKVVKKTTEPSGTFEVTRVQLSPEDLAANNLEKARAALSKGNREEGQALLEKALVVKPDHVEVRSELAAYWYGRGMTTRALTLLQQGLDMHPQQPQWQLLFARILERIGRVEQAYGALVNIRSDAAEAQELLQLRAMAATQLGYFSEAAADYTVLASNTNEGRWWLAAAVAHEDGDNLAAAVRCYQQAIAAQDLGADAKQYVSQRLTVLEGY